VTPVLVDAFTTVGFCASVAAGYFVVTRLSKLVIAAELSDGCTVCYLLGVIPTGPPYWLLRAHLRSMARETEKTRRKTAA
jgi:hypothetical protein